jgi:hypothetical protein
MRGFINEAERMVLLDWARRMRPHLTANGADRAYLKTQLLPERPALYRQICERIERRLALSGFEQEPMFGWYLSIIDRGGAVHSHLDPVDSRRRHLRCNLFVQLPDQGGYPIIQGKTYPVANGDLLAFFPSERRHRSEGVQGTLSRIICSFGYLTPLSYNIPPTADNAPDNSFAPKSTI